MSDKEDIKQDAWYDRQREEREVEFRVYLNLKAMVYVRADEDITEEELEELALNRLVLCDIDDGDMEDWEEI